MARVPLRVLIERIEARCMANDGPVTPTWDEATEEERAEICRLTGVAIKNDRELSQWWQKYSALKNRVEGKRR